MQTALIFLLLLFVPLFARADKIAYLKTGKEALSEIYTRIRDADREIDISDYSIDFCDPMTHVILKELEEMVAKRRAEGHPLRVRIILDSSTLLPAERQPKIAAYYSKFGIDVRYFNRHVSYMNSDSNFRLHSKFTVIDGKTLISGGRNLSGDYYGLEKDLNWIDRDAVIDGGVASLGQASFESLWNHPATFSPPLPSSDSLEAEKKSCLEPWGEREDSIRHYLEANADKIRAENQRVECRDINFIADNSTVDKEGIFSSKENSAYRDFLRISKKPTTEAINQVIENARESIILENYNYIPTGGIRAAIAKKCTQIPIDLYTNNFQSLGDPDDWDTHQNSQKDNFDHQTDHELSRYGSLTGKWELSFGSAYFMIHSKVYSIDGKNAVISSSNLDPRSYHSNLESAVIVRNCPEFVNKVNDAAAELGKAWQEDTAEPCLETPTLEPSFFKRVYYKLIEQLL
jgi:putative cardiolipin synthase